MSKEFAMMTVTRKLENYISRESYNLTKMLKNERVSESFFELKASQHNELIETLNDFFGVMLNTDNLLFERFITPAEQDIIDGGSQIIVDTGVLYDVSSNNTSIGLSSGGRHNEVYGVVEPELVIYNNSVDNDVQDESEVTKWAQDGYASYSEWLSDKETEAIESVDDLTVTVNTSLSQHRVHQALEEYTNTTEVDIVNHDADDDKPVSVLPGDIERERTELSENREHQQAELYQQQLAKQDEHHQRQLAQQTEQYREQSELQKQRQLELSQQVEQYRTDVETQELQREQEQSQFGEPSPIENIEQESVDSDNDEQTYTDEQEKYIERPTQNLDYIVKTVGDERLNSDPIQIAVVETAVERDGLEARRGTEIDVANHAYSGGHVEVEGLIDDELFGLQFERKNVNQNTDE